MINVELKGGVIREYDENITAAEVAKSIGAGLYKSVCAAKIDGELCDLRTPLTKDCKLELLTFDDEEGKKAFWHTTSHILAQAVKRLYPSTKLTIGPAIENGFYYDIDSEIAFTPAELKYRVYIIDEVHMLTIEAFNALLKTLEERKVDN